jgi:hypothetical protein
MKIRLEAEMLREQLHMASSGIRGGPSAIMASLNAHKVYFCIKDKISDV